MAVRVFHSDDSEAFRVLVAELISDERGLDLVGQAADSEETVAGVRATQPDVVLLDLHGADLGPELIPRVRAAAPGCAIVVVSGWDGPIDESDLAARLNKGASSDDLVRTIRAAAGVDE